VAGSYRAECKRVVVVQRHGAFPCPSALAQVAALRRCLSYREVGNLGVGEVGVRAGHERRARRQGRQ